MTVADDDFFFDAYDREEIAYGDRASAPLVAYLNQVGGRGAVLDLGAGAGRDSIALAKAGFHVTAVDLSERGLDRIRQRGERLGLGDRITTKAADVRELDFPSGAFQAIVATTVLDHIPASDAADVWPRLCRWLDTTGMMYVEVHTTEDPGSGQPPGCASDAPISETADAVVNYFAPNRLAHMATLDDVDLRILRYEERLEWDYTHGPEHLHGKAVLLAVRRGFHPPWYGQPPAFPRQN